MFKKILVPVDGSHPAEDALETAADLAKQLKSDLVLCHALLYGAPIEQLKETAKDKGFLKDVEKDLEEGVVIPPAVAGGAAAPPQTLNDEALEKFANLLLEQAKKRIGKKGAKSVKTQILEGSPADAITKFAKKEKVDLIVTGSRGFGDVKSILLGSVSHDLIKQSDIPCLVVK